MPAPGTGAAKPGTGAITGCNNQLTGSIMAKKSRRTPGGFIPNLEMILAGRLAMKSIILNLV